MSLKDFYHDTEAALGLKSQVLQSAGADSADMDKQGWETTIHSVNVGASADTLSGSVYWELVLCAGDAASPTDPVTDAAHYNGTLETPSTGVLKKIDANTKDEALYRIEYKGPKRYSRIRIVKTGTHTNGTPFGVSSLNCGAKYAGPSFLPAL